MVKPGLETVRIGELLTEAPNAARVLWGLKFGVSLELGLEFGASNRTNRFENRLRLPGAHA